MIRSEHWLSPPGLPEGSIFMRRLAPEKPTRRPVLCIHGATIASTLFDARNASLLSELAQAGHAAYALDLRGYARSANAIAGVSSLESLRLEAVAEDVHTAVSFIERKEAHAQIHLVGASWGSVIAGRIAASALRDRIARLVLYAPLCDTPDSAEFARLFGSPDLATLPLTRTVTWPAFWSRWQNEHEGAPEAWLDPATWEDVKSSFSEDGSPAEIPNGCIADLAEVFSGNPLYRPSDIRAPTLVVRGSLDFTATRAGALSIFDRLPHGESAYHEVPNSGHFGLIERAGHNFHQTVGTFFQN